jgi:hypothetical protein
LVGAARIVIERINAGRQIINYRQAAPRRSLELMNALSNNHPFRRIDPTSVLAALLLILGGGCQTFSMSDADFQKQQRGQMVDPQVGTAVGAAGSVGALGAILGATVATLAHK